MAADLPGETRGSLAKRATRSYDTGMQRVIGIVLVGFSLIAPMGDALAEPAPAIAPLGETKPAESASSSEATGQNSSSEVAGPNSSSEAAGPNSSSEAAGPNSSSEAAGPSSSGEAAGPSSSSEAAGPNAVRAAPPANMSYATSSPAGAQHAVLTDDSRLQDSSATDGPWLCSSAELDQYARRRAFTLRLIEERERQKFESEVSWYAQRLGFTERLMGERARMADVVKKKFNEQVELYTRLREVTQQLQDEHDLQDALRFAEELALMERKRAFTQKLLASRSLANTDAAQGAR